MNSILLLESRRRIIDFFQVTTNVLDGKVARSTVSGTPSLAFASQGLFIETRPVHCRISINGLHRVHMFCGYTSPENISQRLAKVSISGESRGQRLFPGSIMLRHQLSYKCRFPGYVISIPVSLLALIGRE